MLTSLVTRDLQSDHHFLALPCTLCVPADMCQRHPLPSGFSGFRVGSARPSSAHIKWPFPATHRTGDNIEGRPLHGFSCGLLDIAAVASTWVSIPVYANTSIINVCSPPRVGIHRHSSAGAPGGVVRFLYDDPGQTRPLDSWAGTLCPSPAQFESGSPFRAISGKPNSSASSSRLRRLVPPSTEQICLDCSFGCRRGVNAHLFAFFYTRYLQPIRAYSRSMCRLCGLYLSPG